MMKFEITSSIRQSLTPHHRLVQGAVATLANEILGSPEPPRGIGRHEGGVYVNGQEVTITRDRVVSAGSYDDEPSNEEKAVSEAIARVVSLWERQELLGLEAFDPVRQGEPLRLMLSLIDVEQPA